MRHRAAKALASSFVVAVGFISLAVISPPPAFAYTGEFCYQVLLGLDRAISPAAEGVAQVGCGRFGRWRIS